MTICRTADGVSVVIHSEILLIFVTPDLLLLLLLLLLSIINQKYCSFDCTSSLLYHVSQMHYDVLECPSSDVRLDTLQI